MAREFGVVILGNHDEAALWSESVESFNPVARAAVEWTRTLLDDSKDRYRNTKRWDFLGELQRTYKQNSSLYVHGSPRKPVREYVFPEDVANKVKMQDLFAKIEHVCFIGHSHMPGVFTEDMAFKPPQEVFNRYDIDFQDHHQCRVGRPAARRGYARLLRRGRRRKRGVCPGPVRF